MKSTTPGSRDCRARRQAPGASWTSGARRWHRGVALCLSLISVAAAAQRYEDRVVAAVLMGEAWSEGVRGMVAVAEVVHQRSLDKQQSWYRVVTLRNGPVHAFSCLNGTTPDALVRKFHREKDFQTALGVVRAVRQGQHPFAGITRSATHFTLARERAPWAKDLQPVAVVGRHAFYRMRTY